MSHFNSLLVFHDQFNDQCCPEGFDVQSVNPHMLFDDPDPPDLKSIDRARPLLHYQDRQLVKKGRSKPISPRKGVQNKALQVTPYLISSQAISDPDTTSSASPSAPDPLSASLESLFTYPYHDHLSIDSHLADSLNLPSSALLTDQVDIMRPNAAEQHPCPSCELVFKRKDSLTLHYRLHTGIRPFFCTYPGCEQSFFSKTARTRHQSSHRAEKDFHCPSCPKKFKMADALLKHAKKHSPANYACSICGRRFGRKDNMAVHLLTHSQEKKYSCVICQKQFRQRSGLSFHMRVHELPRPFQCTQCEKRFAEKTSLTKHMSFHENEAEIMS